MYGLLCTMSVGGLQYFITFIYDYSNYFYVDKMKCKLDAFKCFKPFHVMTERYIDTKLKILHSEGGEGYTCDAFLQHMALRNIPHKPTVPYNPHQNSVTEQLTRTLA